MKTSVFRHMWVGLVLFGSVALFPSVGASQVATPLRDGAVVEGKTAQEGPAVYGFEAESAGVLTIVVRSQDDTDLFLLVTDSDGQPLPEGRSDQDLGGDTGAEQFAVTLPRAGEYRIRVESYGEGSAPFKIGVSWIAFLDLAVPEDPDGSPASAIRVRVGQETRNDSIDPAKGDFWDWFVLTAEQPGTLTVATRAEDGDLVLEAFNPGEFTEASERSDQDLQGTGGNEALTLAVEAGDELFFKVSAFISKTPVSYRLQIGFIPN